MSSASESVVIPRETGTAENDAHDPQHYAEARRKALEWMGDRYLLASPVTRLDNGLGVADRKE
jgi:hypothetical protein